MVKRYLKYMRLGVENIKKSREKKFQASNLHFKFQKRFQRHVFKGIRQVLDKEAKWLEAVKEEFAMQLLERTLVLMKQFVKITKCERNHEMNIKQGFFKVACEEL